MAGGNLRLACIRASISRFRSRGDLRSLLASLLEAAVLVGDSHAVATCAADVVDLCPLPLSLCLSAVARRRLEDFCLASIDRSVSIEGGDDGDNGEVAREEREAVEGVPGVFGSFWSTKAWSDNECCNWEVSIVRGAGSIGP